MNISNLNTIEQKVRGLQRRLARGMQVVFNPQKVYLYSKNIYSYHNLSYSHEGEDMILAKFFSNKSSGFYIDIGAHHPQRFSNTYYFYLRGWRGINIDAMPNSMNIFKAIRPEDINIETPISERPETLTYYEFNEPALNSFCPTISQSRNGLKNYKIISTKKLQTKTLTEILNNYFPNNCQEIDFMTIDVEGFDLQVLKSNDWNKYRPKMVLVEDLKRASFYKDKKSELDEYMAKCNYELYAKSVNTVFYQRND